MWVNATIDGRPGLVNLDHVRAAERRESSYVLIGADDGIIGITNADLGPLAAALTTLPRSPA